MNGKSQMKCLNQNQNGMTLFEVLVVISILSIISILMLHIMTVNSRESAKLLSRVERSQSLYAAERSFFGDLECAVPYPRDAKAVFRLENGMEGEVDSDRVTFVLPRRQGEGEAIGMVERAYYLQREMYGAKPVWLLAWSDDTSPDGSVEGSRGHVVTVLSGMQSVSFSVEAAAAGERSWREKWEDEESLPERLRIRLKVTDPRDPDHPVEILDTVYLMAG
jgi:prepilin-type N-terminal cleavage/methylation domain-containing protein